ncbi:carbohydrate sulfotransferase 9 isoform X1 [Crotalus tigris]|uniref:carbohydrate sulfotransferase 9 isoform X1 n=2 Tax=Crotalus tigris TaxID=88082 RepID=UPI00192F7686|nr:carbohydrate sulfotransferase 9 isoform X1 [Crotalus tigris]XP_039184559.1 carbohydrate sulfotransferase 9 isoform X1 [Crotalus tigris]
MNLKLTYVSVLVFGVAGLIVLTYLQTCIEDQHAGTAEKMQQQMINQDFGSYSTEESKKPKENWIVGKYFHKDSKALIESENSQESYLFGETEDSLTTNFSEDPQKVLKQLKKMNFSSTKFYQNKLFNRNNNWKTTDEIQEKRKFFLRNICQKYVNGNRTQTPLVHMVSRIYVEDKYKLLYCEVPKAGCSNWKRILMILSGLTKSAANISHDSVHYGDHLKKLDSYNIKEIQKRLKTYTKIIFVRDPMERLVSAFRDKFEHPNSYYHPIFGKAIIKKYRPNADPLTTGSGVQFKEFIQYLLDPYRPLGMDTHWEQINKLCYPCNINYNFIGKFETLEKDANYFLKLINAPDELLFPHFKDRHSTDKRTNSEVVMKYLAEIPATERLQVYNFYYLDYLMFNYTVPYETFQFDVIHNPVYL